MTLTTSIIGKIFLYLTFKKLGFQIDPLPPFRNLSLLKLFFFWMASLIVYSLIVKTRMVKYQVYGGTAHETFFALLVNVFNHLHLL